MKFFTFVTSLFLVANLAQAQSGESANSSGNNANNMGSGSDITPGTGTVINRSARSPTKTHMTISKGTTGDKNANTTVDQGVQKKTANPKHANDAKKRQSESGVDFQ